MPGAASAADGVDENHGVGVFEIRQQRQAERAAVEHAHAVGRNVAIVEQRHGRAADAVVLEQEVAEAEHEQRRRVHSSTWPCRLMKR